MFCARVVSNNDPDRVEVDGVPLLSISTMGLDHFSGEIVLRGKDAALDPVVIRAPFGCTIEVYH